MNAASIQASLFPEGNSLYSAPEGFRDECVMPDGSLSPHWAQALEGFGKIGSDGLRKREEQLRRMIQEHGITFNVYGDPKGSFRPWTMDLVPAILTAEEWPWLEEAIKQRVRLLNILLDDCYGRQRALHDGAIPPALIFGNPLFLRPCVGLLPKECTYIHLYTADLARSSDSRWWVLADRVDSPSGFGYTLENRQLSRRILPDVFRQLRVQSLQGFFDRFLSSFEHLAPWTKDRPKIAYLTPGPANETYFEQSYLARNLGFPLVEGADLLVRNNRVLLKTLGGTQTVDVLIRRVDSTYCDPLEFRAESLLGVPGLVQAIRHGRVTVANALGCGLVEAPAVQAFLPSLCRYYLNEDLIMPSVATWWCGQEKERAYVLEHFDELVIKSTFRRSANQAVFVPELTKAKRAELRAAIIANPERYCAQEMVSKSTTPALVNDHLAPKHFLLRGCAVHDRGDYHILPGGLTRIASSNHPTSVAMQKGGRSKDTWVLLAKDSQQSDSPLVLPNTATEIRRGRTDVPSRVADNLYWFGRYLERSDNLSRLLRLLMNSLVEDTEESIRIGASLWVHLKNEATTTHPSISAQLEHILCNNLYGVEGWLGLYDNLGFIHRSAFCIKERLSMDAWQIISRLQEIAASRPADTRTLDESAYGQINEILTLLAALNGLSNENMTRGQGWFFLDLGHRIERASTTTTIALNAIRNGGIHSEYLLRNLITWADSLLTYRRRYLSSMASAPVLDLLLLDPANPRSLAFQCDQICRHTVALPQPVGTDITPARIGRQLKSATVEMGLRPLFRNPSGADPSSIIPDLENIQNSLYEVSDIISQIYFSNSSSLLLHTSEPHART
ncbi:MAG: circularly permuted type 2 ATP-grasp protein [Verrucomicrobiota bacterium]|nr:circularly permuted type 2 ATP-grasp protein [Verrucomicrobiota bacterium]